jgi:hypothetical protein
MIRSPLRNSSLGLSAATTHAGISTAAIAAAVKNQVAHRDFARLIIAVRAS